MSAFNGDHVVYREAVHAAVDAFESGNDLLFERAFGVCCGIATMLIPGVASGPAPDPSVADAVCKQVTGDIAAMTT